MIKISDLRNREVINIVDGRRLGTIYDLDLDLETAGLQQLLSPAQPGC